MDREQAVMENRRSKLDELQEAADKLREKRKHAERDLVDAEDELAMAEGNVGDAHDKLDGIKEELEELHTKKLKLEKINSPIDWAVEVLTKRAGWRYLAGKHEGTEYRTDGRWLLRYDLLPEAMQSMPVDSETGVSRVIEGARVVERLEAGDTITELGESYLELTNKDGTLVVDKDMYDALMIITDQSIEFWRTDGENQPGVPVGLTLKGKLVGMLMPIRMEHVENCKS